LQPDHGEHLHLKTKRAAFHVGVVAADEACLFQGADPAQARWRRDTHPLGQLHIGHAAIRL